MAIRAERTVRGSRAGAVRSMVGSKPRRRRTGAVVAVPAPAAPVAVAGGPVRAVDEPYRDGLTGLGSLLDLRRNLEQVLEQYQPFGVRPALLLIDVDGFGRTNSVYGRSTADEVLVATAARLRRMVPGEYATYRTGGDEFVALIGPTPMIDAVESAGLLQRALGDPVEVAGSEIPVSVSVAVVMLGYRHRVDGLLRDADVTMYRAKAEGGNRVDIYNWELDSWSTARKRDVERLEKEVEELRLQNRVLADALTVDLDTGMPNGLAFEADHLQSDAWRRRSGEPYSVLRGRVDGIYESALDFRSAAGAAALAAVAQSVRDTFRQSDRAYVLDRGEYAVLLRGAGVKQAVAAAERVRAGVERLSVTHPGDPGRRLGLTVAAIEAGFRHTGPADVLAEVNRLLDGAAARGLRIVWPH